MRYMISMINYNYIPPCVLARYGLNKPDVSLALMGEVYKM
jgi:hypothetical protein